MVWAVGDFRSTSHRNSVSYNISTPQTRATNSFHQLRIGRFFEIDDVSLQFQESKPPEHVFPVNSFNALCPAGRHGYECQPSSALSRRVESRKALLSHIMSLVRAVFLKGSSALSIHLLPLEFEHTQHTS
jgi:hypothetical protein